MINYHRRRGGIDDDEVNTEEEENRAEEPQAIFHEVSDKHSMHLTGFRHHARLRVVDVFPVRLIPSDAAIPD